MVGITGRKKIAFEIKNRIRDYLKENLKLELDMGKTKITYMTRNLAYFLGTEIKITDSEDTYSSRSIYMQNGKNYTKLLPSTSTVKMYAPIKKLIEKLKDKGFVKQVIIPAKQKIVFNSIGRKKIKKELSGKIRIVPCGNTRLIMLTEVQLLERYQAVLRGILNYYSFVHNYNNLHRVMYILKFSLICTLARKLRLNTAKIIKKYYYNND
jgi:hypothetical protein